MNLVHPHFAEPEWLWLAVLGPVVLLLLHRYSEARRRRQLSVIVSPAFLERLTASHSRLRRTFKETLLVLAVALVGVALARPQWGEREDAMRLLGRDVLFVLDCSRSMLATDVSPNRLQRAKLAILNYVQHYGRGRVGLVAFSGQAFLQCPLTFDYDAFEDALAFVDDRTIPVPGTDIGRALQEGLQAMEKNDGQKVMVLLTDGEDLEKVGVTTAQKLAGQGIVVFTVGVGTEAGTEVQRLDDQGRALPVRDSQGRAVVSRLDPATLQAVAKATGGQYYPLGPLGEGLARVRLAIEDLPPDPGSAPARKFGIDRFHWPMAGIIFLLVTESLVGTRRRRGAGPNWGSAAAGTGR